MTQEVPALRALKPFKIILTTPSRAWLLNAGPSGLHSSWNRPEDSINPVAIFPFTVYLSTAACGLRINRCQREKVLISSLRKLM